MMVCPCQESHGKKFQVDRVITLYGGDSFQGNVGEIEIGKVTYRLELEYDKPNDRYRYHVEIFDTDGTRLGSGTGEWFTHAKQFDWRLRVERITLQPGGNWITVQVME